MEVKKPTSQERVIRDPSPRIVRAEQYAEEVRRAAENKLDTEDDMENVF